MHIKVDFGPGIIQMRYYACWKCKVFSSLISFSVLHSFSMLSEYSNIPAIVSLQEETKNIMLMNFAHWCKTPECSLKLHQKDKELFMASDDGGCGIHYKYTFIHFWHLIVCFGLLGCSQVHNRSDNYGLIILFICPAVDSNNLLAALTSEPLKDKVRQYPVSVSFLCCERTHL